MKSSFKWALERWGGKRLRSHHDALSPLRALSRPGGDVHSLVREARPDDRPRAIYVHVPFCSHNCPFCNLNRRSASPPPDYVDLVCREIEGFAALPYLRAGRYGAVYFGGGTPTSLSPEGIPRILGTLRASLEIHPDAEITVETTVSDLTPEHIAALREAGVNRLSVGIQTFCDRGRRLLGRWGTGEEAAAKLEGLLTAGFRNVGIDLIYNWPGQTPEELAADLEVIASLDIAGVSFYPLILHPEAPIVRLLSSGACPPMGDLYYEKRLFDLIWEELTEAGFVLLELTKLVRPGRDAYRYVAIRYAGGDTLGLGAGAGGRLGNVLYLNPSDIPRWRARVERGLLGPATPRMLAALHPPRRGNGGEAPTLVRRLIRARGICARVPPLYPLAYRLVGAVEFDRLRWAEFPPELRAILAPELEGLAAAGLVRPSPAGFSLTPDGVFWGHNIARDLARAVIQVLGENPPPSAGEETTKEVG